MILCLPGCASEPLLRQFKAVQGFTEEVVRLQADANRKNRRVHREATVRSALADLDVVQAELFVNLEHSSARRIEDCEGRVAAVLDNRTRMELDALKKRINFSEANRAVGEGNLRRQYYYQHAYFAKLSDLAKDQLGWIRVARGRVRAGFADASCAVAASRQVAHAHYRQQMGAVNAEWKRECCTEVLNYEGELKAMRDQMSDLEESLAEPRLAQALGLRKAPSEPVEPVFPTGFDVERCFRETLEQRSTSAANRAEETMRKTFHEALAQAQQVRCLPDNFDKKHHPNDLDPKVRASCTGFQKRCPQPGSVGVNCPGCIEATGDGNCYKPGKERSRTNGE